MVDISLLFRRAEVAFFLNLHNALMLHTHMHRGTMAGEGLRSLRARLLKLHQYRVGGQMYHLEHMQHRLLRSKPAKGGGGLVEPRLHFAISLGCVSCPDVRVYSVDNLDEELTAAAAALCLRDVSISHDPNGSKTLVLPKLFKWFARDLPDASSGGGGGGSNKPMAAINFILRQLQQALSLGPGPNALALEVPKPLDSTP